MSDIVTTDKPTHDEVIRVLENSLYPGAKRESIELVLAYCRANGLDPMLRPVYIVPTSIKKPDGQWETRDVLMPGIADYRIKAARSGEYGGKSEPEFGPDVRETLNDVAVTYPAWCRVTVKRIVQGREREFVAMERWLENYATAGRNTQAPNTMWKKRPYGQLAKVAEAQALRMAFPEFSAGYTMEEMQGKTLQEEWSGTTLDAEAPLSAPLSPRQQRQRGVDARGNPWRSAEGEDADRAEAAERERAAAAPTPRGERKVAEKSPPAARTDEQWRVWVDKLRAACAVLYRRSEVIEVGNRPSVGDAIATGPAWVRAEVSAILAENYARFPEEPDAETPDDLHIEGEQYAAAG